MCSQSLRQWLHRPRRSFLLRGSRLSLVGGLGLLLLAASAIPTARAADPQPERLTIGTWNLEWFFDEQQGDNYSKLARKLSAPSRPDWNWKRDQAARVIAALKPTVMALQEVENRQVVWYLVRRLQEDHDLHYRIAFITGSDYFTEQDVAIIYRSGLVEYSRRERTRAEARDKRLYNVSKHLWGRFRWGPEGSAESLTLLALHLRSSPKGAPIRQRQARLVRKWLAETSLKSENVVVLGDFNTEEPPRPAANSDMAIFRGWTTPTPDDDLFDLHERLPERQQVTHLTGKRLDRILVSSPLLKDAPGRRDLVFQRVYTAESLVVRGAGRDKDHREGYYQIPEAERDVSDHYPLLAEFQWRD